MLELALLVAPFPAATIARRPGLGPPLPRNHCFRIFKFSDCRAAEIPGRHGRTAFFEKIKGNGV